MAGALCPERTWREVTSELICKGLYLGHSLCFDCFPFIRLRSGPHPQLSQGRAGVPGRAAYPCQSCGASSGSGQAARVQIPALTLRLCGLDFPLPWPHVVSGMIRWGLPTEPGIVRGTQQAWALLAPGPEGPKGGHSGEVDAFLLKGQLRVWGAGYHLPVSGPF